MDEMGSEESFQEVPAIQVPMTSEERLLRRLGEVDRFVANITAELQKSKPCKGVITRELMERELGALNRDRESIEQKLGLLLSSFAVAPKHGIYLLKHGNSPPDIAPIWNASISSTARVGKGRERAKETPPPRVAPSVTGGRNAGDVAPLKRTSSGASSGHASNAPPPSSPPGYRGEVAGPGYGGNGGGGREVFPGGGPRTRPPSSALGKRDQYPGSIRHGGRGRRENEPSVQRQALKDADQRPYHSQPDERRPDQPRWAVIGGSARGREDRQYQAGVDEPTRPAAANPPLEGFFNRDFNQGRLLRGTPDDMIQRRWTRDPQTPERGESRTRNRPEQGSGGDTTGGRRDSFRAPKISSLIHPNCRQQYTPPAHDAPATRASPLRGAPLQFEGGYFHHGDGDREDLAGERERRLKRRALRQPDEASGTSSRSWRAAPPAWSVEGGGSEAGARAAYGSARVSVPVAMTVDNHHIDRSHTDTHHSDAHARHVDTRRVLGYNRRAGPSDLPNAKRFVNSNRYPTSNGSNQRYVDSSNTDYDWAHDDSGNRAVDTTTHADNRYVDTHSHQTSRRYNDVESRSGKRGRWHQQGQEPEREQRYFQAETLRYSPRLASCVTAANDSSGWARGKLGAYDLTAHSPTH